MRRFVLSLSALTLLGCTLPAVAQEPAPFAASLNGQRIELELANVEVKIVLSPGAEPTLEAEPLVEGADPAALLRVTDRRGVVSVSRVDHPESRDRDLALQVVLDPRQALAIRGHELDLGVRLANPDEKPTTVDEAKQSEPVDDERRPEAAPIAAAGPLPVAIDVTASDVVLRGVPGATVTLEGGTFLATRCSGRIEITGSHGRAEIRGLNGSLDLEGREHEFAATGGRGPIEINLEGGALFARQGRGAVSGRATGSRVQLERWNGAPSITGDGSTIEIRRSRGERANVSGERLDIQIEEWRGALTARVAGSTLGGEGWQGAAEVTARDWSSVDVTDVRGPMTLELSGRSTATVSGVTQEFKAQVNDGSLEADRVGTVSVVGVGSRVSLRDVIKVSKLRVTDGELDADLKKVRGITSVTLDGTSRGDFELSQPCVVWTQGPGSKLGSGTTVSGCEQRIPGQPRARGRRRRVPGGEQRQLRLALGAEASAQVSGSP